MTATAPSLEHPGRAPAAGPSLRAASMAILLIFFLSGACGLVYETVWQKMLCLVFGITIYATTTILAAFMGGLALGSFILGRYADRSRRPLRAYAYLEAGVGIFALVFPLVVQGINALFAGVSAQLHPPAFITGLIRFLLCFVVLAVPAVLMGGTLPMVSKYYVRHIRVVGVGTGTLYGLNTLGGVAGCFLAGFVLMVDFGTHATLYGAAVTNLALAALALVIDRAFPSPVAPPVSSGAGSREERRVEAGAAAGRGDLVFRLLLAASAISGFCALAYEVLWTRTLGLFLESSVYAFPTMLTTFLCGSALGSLLYAKIFDRARRSIVLLGILQLLVGVTAALTILEFRYVGVVAPHILARLGEGWRASTGTGFVSSFLVMLLPSLLMGIAFPLITKAFTRSIARLGRSIGSLYSANTLGCVLGSILAGFAIVPVLGIVKGIALVAVLNAVLGVLLLVSVSGTARTRALAVAAGVGALAIVGCLAFAWRVPVALYSPRFARLVTNGDSVIYYKDGVGGTVTVTAISNHVIDGKRYKDIEVDGVSVAGDAPVLRTTQKIQGHVPLLLFKAATGRDPGRAFILGLGTGEASSCIARHDIRALDCAELVSAEVGANYLFRGINNDILHNPKFNLVINDARNHLLTTSETYDIIQSDSVHPAIAFNTYTKEYYELCRRRLSDQGVFSTWIPLFSFTEDDMKTLIRTMLSVFPHVSVWWAPNFDNKHAILIGMNHPIRIDYPILKAEVSKPAVKASLDEVDLGAMASVLGAFVADETTLGPYSEGAPVNTDDNLLLPYGIPKNARSGERTLPENLDAFGRLSMTILPYVRNLSATERADIGIDPYYAARGHVLRGLKAYFQGKDQGEEAEAKAFSESAGEYEAALRENPRDPAVKRLLAEMRFFGALSAGEALKRNGKYAMALAQFEGALAIQPMNPTAYNQIAICYDRMGVREKTIEYLTKALEVAPDFPVARNNLALYYWKTGDAGRAREELGKSLEFSPYYAESRRISKLIGGMP